MSLLLLLAEAIKIKILVVNILGIFFIKILWGSWIRIAVPTGDIFWGATSGWHDKKLWQMLELICVVSAHVYIKQYIDMLNVFKVNYEGNRATLLKVPLLFLLLNLDMLVTWIWFSVVGQRNSLWIAPFPDGAKFIGWNIAVLNWKLLCRNLLDW